MMLFMLLVPLCLAQDLGHVTSPCECPGPDPCFCVASHLCDRATNNISDTRSQAAARCPEPGQCCRYALASSPPPPLPPSTDGCGVRRSWHTSENDSSTTFGEFPWLAALQLAEIRHGRLHEELMCVATLLNSRVALTSAHCVAGWDARQLAVVAGDWDVASTGDETLARQVRQVEAVITHPQYRQDSLQRDLALLVFQELQERDGVAGLCLPERDAGPPGNSCLATGWEEDPHTMSLVSTPRKVQAALVNHTACQSLLRQSALGPHFNLHSSFLCAAARDNHSNQLSGGSPVVCAGVGGRYHLFGLLSWDPSSDNTTFPGVYTDVMQHRDWIEEQLGTLISNSAGQDVRPQPWNRLRE